MKRTITLFLSLALLLALPFLSQADPVSPQKARTVANNFLKSIGEKPLALQDISSTIPYSQFYLFAGSDGKGFVLVSADDCVLPILGYSVSNTFAVENMPQNIRGWLDDYESQILFYKNLQASQPLRNSADDSVARQWRRLLNGAQPTPPLNTAVSPLLTTTWNQTTYYNNLCPYDSYEGDRTLTGCVATATAQVMKYWNHPTTGSGSHSYTHTYYSTLSANFGTTTYNWSSMPNALTSSSSSTQITAVATLMYHVGVAIEMDYGVDASSAPSFCDGDHTKASAENALRTYFKYKPSLHQVNIADYSSAAWSSMLTSELVASRPVIYTGYDASSGHCFVCDGCNNSGQFHFNWGWGSYCDGYYTIGSLNPTPGGSGSSSSSTYNIRNSAIIGIQPNTNFGSTTSVTVSSNNTSYGTVSGGGTYSGTNTNAVSLTATAATGCRFTGWNDGYKYNPRSFYANGGTYSYTANFEPLSGDTLGYCQHHRITSLRDNSGTSTWGIKLPASVLTAGHNLTQVSFYASESGNYTLYVYTGTSSPSTTATTQTVYVPAAYKGQWCTATLSSPVTITGTQSVWIAFSYTEGSTTAYPASMSYSAGNSDALLWGSSLDPLTSWNYSFMIRGIFSSGTPTPPSSGDTLSYCGNNAYALSWGGLNPMTWGVKFLPSALSGRTQLSAVRLFVYEGSTYQLSIYQGSNTTSTTLVTTQSYSFSADSAWQTCTLTTPVSIDTTQPLWVVFSNSLLSYPAASCTYTGDTNSSLLLYNNNWISIYTATGGQSQNSWMIQAITSGSGGSTGGDTIVYGDTVSFCGTNAYSSSIGSSGSGNIYWGIQLPSSMHQHRNYLTDVMLYVSAATTHTLNIYQGTSTSSSNLVATQTATFSSSDQNTWKTIHLSTPLALNSAQPLWITFGATANLYPAAMCSFSGDSNSSLVSTDGSTWYTLAAATSNSLNGSWMIRAILSQTASTLSVTINGPTTVGSGVPASFTAAGPAGATYSWTLSGATPATATGNSVSATWNTPGTYNVIVAATTSAGTARDTLSVSVTSCAVTTFPYTMGAETSDNVECWNFIDNDHDGYGWSITSFGSAYAHSGTSYFGSASYINDIGALSPDNYLVSPAVQLTSGYNYTLTWYDRALDANYATDQYSVYVSTTGNSVSNFTGTPVFQSNSRDTNYTLRTVNLNSYAGQTIYIAFRHHNSNDIYWLLLDDITITQTAIPNYTLTVLSADPTMGSVSGGGTYPSGTNVTISATPNSGYHFLHWNDGNTSASRTVTVTADATYTATFQANAPDTVYYTLTVLSADPTMGSVSGGGTYPSGTNVTISATPNSGYHFLHWNDGNTSASRTVTVTSDATYTATFQANAPDTVYYTLTVLSADPTMGSVSGGGTYPSGTNVTISATPNSGYHFLQWNDGNTSSSRTVTVTSDATYTATFQIDQPESINNPDADASITLTPLPGCQLRIEAPAGHPITVYDLMGRLIAHLPSAQPTTLLTLPHPGLYLVHITPHPARKIIIM